MNPVRPLQGDGLRGKTLITSYQQGLLCVHFKFTISISNEAFKLFVYYLHIRIPDRLNNQLAFQIEAQSDLCDLGSFILSIYKKYIHNNKSNNTDIVVIVYDDRFIVSRYRHRVDRYLTLSQSRGLGYDLSCGGRVCCIVVFEYEGGRTLADHQHSSVRIGSRDDRNHTRVYDPQTSHAVNSQPRVHN